MQLGRLAKNCERGSVASHDGLVNTLVQDFLIFLNHPFLTLSQVSGDDRGRTDNLCRARAALSQLSYVPSTYRITAVGVRGLEPRTSALSELRSNHLSYTPRRIIRSGGRTFWHSNAQLSSLSAPA